MSGAPDRVERDLSNALHFLRRVSRHAERCGWLMLSLAAREAVFNLESATAEESAFRASRGVS